MSGSGPIDPNQMREWLERERARLRREGQTREQTESEAWIGSLREWLKLLRPSAGAWFGAATGDEFNQAFQGLRAAQEGAWGALLKLPSLGLAGSYFEPWKQLQAADAEFRTIEERFRETLIDLHLQTLDELERRLGSRKTPWPAERELFDLWVECGEVVFAKMAHSTEFAQLQGAMSNATVHRLRAQQAILEQLSRMFDLPTRSELNSVHRQLRTLRQELDSLKPSTTRKKSKQKTAAKTPAQKKPRSKTSRAKARKASR
jgi:class III poly(R)-hydroxyalkanoic acid synthase PhaE subunit